MCSQRALNFLPDTDSKLQLGNYLYYLLNTVPPPDGTFVASFYLFLKLNVKKVVSLGSLCLYCQLADTIY